MWVGSARASVVGFFALSFGLSWLVWGSRLLHERGVIGGQHDVSALVPLSAAVPLLLSQLLLHLLTQELGWRGFALPRLRPVLGPLSASLVLGPIWAAWHIPTFLLSDSRQSYPFLGFVLQVISITVIMTWIFDRTRGSVLIAALFHGAMNTAWALLNILWGDASLFWLCVGFTVVVAVAVALVQARDGASSRADNDHSARSGAPRPTPVAGV